MLHTWLPALLSALVVSLISFAGVFLLSLRGGRLDKVLMYLVSFAVGAFAGQRTVPPAARGLCTYFIFVDCLALRSGLPGVLPAGAPAANAPGRAWSGEALRLSEPVCRCHTQLHGRHPHCRGMAGRAGSGHGHHGGHRAARNSTRDKRLRRVAASRFHPTAGLVVQLFYSACTSIVGAVLTLWTGEWLGQLSTYVLPFAAGGFLYLAATSLLPEILKEDSRHRTWLYLLCIAAGVAAMACFTASGGHGH